jgi:hypothetical protein
VELGDQARLCWGVNGEWVRFEGRIVEMRQNPPFLLSVRLENGDLYRVADGGDGYAGEVQVVLLSRGNAPRADGPYDDGFWTGEVAGRPISDDELVQQFEGRIMAPPVRKLEVPLRKIQGRVRITADLLDSFKDRKPGKVDKRVDNRPVHGQKRAYFDE